MNRPARHMRRIDRRSLIGSGALASVLAASGLAAGAQPRQGGVLRMAVPGHAVLSGILNDAVGETLTDLGPTGALHPGLAADWTARNGGAVWDFRVAPRVFHSGTALAAKDIAAALSAHIVPGGRLHDVSRIDLREPAVVRISLDAPDQDFPLRLADPALAVLAVGDGLNGTGPYRVQSHDMTSAFRLQRAEGRRRGWFEGLEILHQPTPEARLDALLSGRVDLAFDLEDGAQKDILRHRRLAMTSVPHPAPLTVKARDGAPEGAFCLLAGQRVDHGASSLSLSVAPDAAEHAGVGRIVGDLVSAADAAGVKLTPGAAESDLRIQAAGHAIAGANMRLGHSTDLGFLTPPDGRRIAGHWFFT